MDELERPGPVPVGLVLPGDAEAGDGVPGPGETVASKDSGHLVRACGCSAGVLPFVPNEQKSPPILGQVLPVEATAHPS
jgi:hypothetical protein